MTSLVHLFERLARSRPPLWGALAVLLAGVPWALFCRVLAEAGHAPSHALLPLPREHYYGAQALFVVPVLFLQWLLCAWVAQRMARRSGGGGSFLGTANVLGVALGLPLLVLFVLPDAWTYGAHGFAALGKLVRVSAPLAFVSSLLLATLALRAVHGLAAGRAFLAASLGMLAQSCAGSLLLR